MVSYAEADVCILDITYPFFKSPVWEILVLVRVLGSD